MLFESMVRDGVDCNAQTYAIMLVLHTRSGLGSTIKECRMRFVFCINAEEITGMLQKEL